MKLGNLLKKELGELFTKQAIISMVFTMVLLIIMGQVMGNVMEESFDTSSITVCNLDDSEFTNELLRKIDDGVSTEINYINIQGEDYASELERLEIKNAVIIPEGYADSVLNKKEAGVLKFVSELPLGGFSGTMNGLSASDVISVIEEATANEILIKTYGVSSDEVGRIENPTILVEYTVLNGKMAQVSSTALSGILMMQAFIAPFVIFFLLLMASQMIMTAISTEKIDKTLETLLSTPVSRMSVLGAKMLAAVIAALANALFMMVGFFFYMTGMMGGMLGEITAVVDSTGVSASIGQVTDMGSAMTAIGLTLSPLSYLLFGVQLFFTLAIGLSVSLILGAMATDVKSVQTLVMPIMIAVLIPFFVTMFTNVNQMSPVVKIILYLIPFTHTYTALTNLMTGDMLIFWIGLAYQIIFFIVCMYLAVKMFTTDKLFTMSFSTDAAKKKKTGFSFKKA